MVHTDSGSRSALTLNGSVGVGGLPRDAKWHKMEACLVGPQTSSSPGPDEVFRGMCHYEGCWADEVCEGP